MSDATNDNPDQKQRSRLLWWLQPKVAFPLMAFVLLLLSPFLVRGYRISQIPDIGEPFDLEAYGSRVVSDEDNAALAYEAAIKLLVRKPSLGDALEKTLEEGWQHATPDIERWLNDNQQALEEWKTATKRPHCVFVQPKEFDHDVPPRLETSIAAWRDFTDLARLQATRLESEGSLAESWEVYSDLLSSSRQVAEVGQMIFQTMGMYMYVKASEGIRRWMKHPLVDVESLQRALNEVQEINERTVPTSKPVRGDYFAVRAYLRAFDRYVAEYASLWGYDSDWINRPTLFVLGETERSERLAKISYAVWLSQADLPRAKRRTHPSRLGFEVPTSLKIGFTPEAYEKAIQEKCCVADKFLADGREYFNDDDRDAAERSLLVTALAAQIYFRKHGSYPARLADLVPEILPKLPLDPYAPVGEPVRSKRDGDELVIYCVGEDGGDDGGDIEMLPTHGRPDLGYRLTPPEPTRQ